MTSTPHVTVWAAFLVAFFGFLRKSNVVPPSTTAFDPSKHISRSSFARCKDGSILLTLTWSKTIQCNERHFTIPFHPIPGSPLCPVSALELMFSRVPAPQDSPAFIMPCASLRPSLTHHSFVAYLRTFLCTIGINPSHYSGHSFRRGGCSFGHSCGIPPDLLQIHGDWRSDAFRQYISIPLQRRRLVANTMTKYIISM